MRSGIILQPYIHRWDKFSYQLVKTVYSQIIKRRLFQGLPQKCSGAGYYLLLLLILLKHSILGLSSSVDISCNYEIFGLTSVCDVVIKTINLWGKSTKDISTWLRKWNYRISSMTSPGRLLVFTRFRGALISWGRGGCACSNESDN